VITRDPDAFRIKPRGTPVLVSSGHPVVRFDVVKAIFLEVEATWRGNPNIIAPRMGSPMIEPRALPIMMSVVTRTRKK
jgi:hypothetical protein